MRDPMLTNALILIHLFIYPIQLYLCQNVTQLFGHKSQLRAARGRF